MANILRRLKIREISGVDRGAGEGVRIMLMKREADMTPAEIAAIETYLKRNVITDAETVAKRVFSPKQRRSAAATGHAMPDGSYPIENGGDLENAVRAIGRAKNPGKTRTHIMAQARRLGMTDKVPPKWVKKAWKKYRVRALGRTAKDLGKIYAITKDAITFDNVLAEMGSTDFAEGVIEAVRDSCHALKDSIESIAEDDTLQPDARSAAISASFGQFMDHLSGIAPGNIVKAMREGAGPMSKLAKKIEKAFTSVGTGTSPNPPAKSTDIKVEDGTDPAIAGQQVRTAVDKKSLKKALKLTRKELAAEQEKCKVWKARAKAALGMTKPQADYLNHPDNDADDEEKAKFLDASAEKREKMMKANPVEAMTAKRIAALPEPVRKKLESAEANSASIAKMNEDAELVEFGKRASAVGQPAEFGANLRLLAKALGTEEERKTAYDEVLKVLDAYAAQAKAAGLFREVGKSGGTTAAGTAYDQLVAKAEEARGEFNKSVAANGKPMTAEQAFDKVYSDPANRELVNQYKNEQRRAA
jgi:hypothetical protein